jgi:tetratricopeptide (TPR) repeat protein
MSFPLPSRAIRIFYSYAAHVHTDKNLVNKIKNHLVPLMWQGLIDDLYDSDKAIRGMAEPADIDRADIIVLFVSPDYFASEYCAKREMERALARSRAGKARLLPVLLRPTEWETSPLCEYMPLPSDGKPVKRPSSAHMDWALLDVSQGIRKVVDELYGTDHTRISTEKLCSLDTLPYGRSPFFTDRKDVLAIIYACFTSRQARQAQVLALSGIPGCGKTQIALEYAYLHKDEYQAILWLDATSQHTGKEAIVSLAESLSLLEEDRADDQRLFNAFKRWLQQHDRWLLILDDVRDLHQITHFVPFQHCGHVLLTTASQATGVFAHRVPVPQMTPEDSAVFLLRRAKVIGEQALREEASETEYTQAGLIVQALGGLALALDQAGAFIEETGYDLASYLKLYREQGAALLAQRGTFVLAHPDSVVKTLSLLFKEATQECPQALELLQLCAFLHPDALPREMIEQGIPALDGSLHMLADMQVLHRSITALLKFSLLQHRVGTTLLSMHRVVQTILVGKLLRRHQRQWASRAVRLLNRVFPEAEFGNWPTCEKYFVQARTCAEHIMTYQLKQKEAARLLQRLGAYCYQRAHYQDAEQYLTAALDVYEQEKKTDQLAIAATLESLALLYQKQGKYQKAQALYQRALQIWEQIYGPEHKTIARILNNQALVYKDEGDYQEAEALYQQVLRIQEHTLGLAHPDTAVFFSNLAMLYEDQGKSALAEALYQRAFAIEETALDANHPDRALSLNMQAIQCEKQGRYTEAESLYQRALTIQQRNGPDHPDTARTLNNLADLYEILQRYQEAEVFYQQAFAIARQAFGLEHHETANILNNLGYLSYQQSRIAEAEALYRQALTIYERTRGPDHHETAIVLTNLGRLYYDIKQDQVAEPLLRRGLAIRERVFGQMNLDTCQSLSALAEVLISQRRYEQAEPLYQRFLIASQQLLGAEHPDVALARQRLSFVLEHRNEQKER